MLKIAVVGALITVGRVCEGGRIGVSTGVGGTCGRSAALRAAKSRFQPLKVLVKKTWEQSTKMVRSVVLSRRACARARSSCVGV